MSKIKSVSLSSRSSPQGKVISETKLNLPVVEEQHTLQFREEANGSLLIAQYGDIKKEADT